MACIVYLGTPDFAVPGLQTLIDHPAFEVVGVVTQPDRPAGRGQKLRQSPVKQAAEAAGLSIFQPPTLRDDAAVAHIKAWNPDALVVAAFGQILRQPVLELAPFGSINVHASLLPRWRGAAPIQYAIHAGDEQTGITIMKMDAGLDTGPMLRQQSIPIEPDETGATLHDKLAQLGAELLPPTLLDYLSGEIVPQPQPEEGVTLAPTLEKAAGEIDWAQSAIEIDRKVRAFTPWPGTFSYLDGKMLKVIGGKPHPDLSHQAQPGTLILEDNLLMVQTGKGSYQLDEIQPAGKKRMSAQAFLAGRPDIAGTSFHSAT